MLGYDSSVGRVGKRRAPAIPAGETSVPMYRTDPQRVILLVDIDAFFPQVEQILRPQLHGRPVIVGGRAEDRSVVASASYEARARGVRTAMPIRQAHRLCPEATFLRGDFHAYARFSRGMMDRCRRYTPLVEPTSLDEAYLDITGCRRLLATAGVADPDEPAWPLQAADHLKRTIRREMDLEVTVGAATNRVVAKIACSRAKPRGVAWVRPGGEAAFLAPLPLRDLPGIGPRTAERLARYNLQRIGDLARIPEAMLAEHFGPAGRTLAERARGIDPTPVTAGASEPRSISRETTFETNLIDTTPMTAMLSYLLQRACRQLREDGLLARTVSVKVRYADFKTVGRSRSLPTFSDHDADFWPVARDLFHRVHTRRVGVRLVGACLSHLAPTGRQMDLFGEQDRDRRRAFYRSVDRVRDRFGFSALVTGPSIDLLATHERDARGFRLRTACLSR